MIAYPEIDPIAFRLGPISVHWYGLMYLVAFAAGWWLGRVRAADPRRGWKAVDLDDVVFFIALGVIAGGRVGYVLFYDFAAFADNPLRLFMVWQGGMSFHGGLLGVIVAMVWFARSRGRRFFDVADFIAPLVPIGLGAGRIGNFINGRLWGGPSDLPWAMVFPGAGAAPRHPSQLYEALLEGVVLFVILWVYSRKPRPPMATAGLFLALYALFRGLVELVRVPDAHLGYLAFDWVTMGHVLSAPMLLGGLALIGLSRGRTPAWPVAREDDAPAKPPRRARRGRKSTK